MPLAAAVALASAALGWLWLGAPGLFAPLVLLALALASARVRLARRRIALASQLSVFLAHVVRACEAGRTLPKAIEAALRDTEDPLRGVFARLCAEMARGTPLADALREAGELYRVRELHIAALPILLHQREGGDLARMLRLMVGALRDRERMSHELGVVRWHTRQLAGALILLPLLFWLGALSGAQLVWVAPLVWSCVLAGFAMLWRMARGV
jgi:tight adherence protein B